MSHLSHNLARALLDLSSGARIEHLARGMIDRLCSRGWGRIMHGEISITPEGNAALEDLCVAGGMNRRAAARRLKTGVI